MSSTSDDLLELVRRQVVALFADVPSDHGMTHIDAVTEHARIAVQTDFPHLSESNKIAVLLAALLHDADDRKLFPDQAPGTYAILRSVQFAQERLVIKMIALVSASQNGNAVEAKRPAW